MATRCGTYDMGDATAVPHGKALIAQVEAHVGRGKAQHSTVLDGGAELVLALLVRELDPSRPGGTDEGVALEEARGIVGVIAQLEPWEGDPRGIEVLVAHELGGDPAAHEAAFTWSDLEERASADLSPEPTFHACAAPSEHSERTRALYPAQASRVEAAKLTYQRRYAAIGPVCARRLRDGTAQGELAIDEQRRVGIWRRAGAPLTKLKREGLRRHRTGDEASRGEHEAREGSRDETGSRGQDTGLKGARGHGAWWQCARWLGRGLQPDPGRAGAIERRMLRIRSVIGNSQRLDGGAMFGNVPRALWSRWCPPDDAGRIALACRALLVEDGQRKILLETGIGSFFEPKLRERFGVVESEHVLCQRLEELGAAHDTIDAVVLSHLHFDHAGGLLAAFEPDVPPRLLFPKARFIVGAEALERAKQPHPRDRASFIPELIGLLEASGRLEVLSGERDEDLRSEVLGARFGFVRSYGHTPGMLHSLVRGDAAEVFFCADLVPGVPWVHLPITMGYDRFPEKLIDEKARVFPRLHERGTWLCFTHDTRVAVAQLREERGRYSTQNELEDAALDLDLDAA